MGWEAELEKIARSLKKEIIDSNEEPNIERSSDLVNALKKHTAIPIKILEATRIGNTLTKCIKTLKRHKRTASNKDEFERIINAGEILLSQWEKAADNEAKKKHKQEQEEAEKVVGLPSSVKMYYARLAKQNKDIYKNPPALPPDHIDIGEEKAPLPKRDKKTGELTFECGQDKYIKHLLRDFHPNRTPEEILRAGSFGGTYFRPIVSAVTNEKYNADEVLNDSVDPKWIEGLDKKTILTSSTYRASVNKYGVKCGGSLGMWESSGWISDADPYGWFQWYCRFYQGRRCSDDERQIQRWAKSAGPKGRFRSQLCNKILSANTRPDDSSISPVIRQTLLHWGLEITENILAKHKNRVSK